MYTYYMPIRRHTHGDNKNIIYDLDSFLFSVFCHSLSLSFTLVLQAKISGDPFVAIIPIHIIIIITICVPAIIRVVTRRLCLPDEFELTNR